MRTVDEAIRRRLHLIPFAVSRDGRQLSCWGKGECSPEEPRRKRSRDRKNPDARDTSRVRPSIGRVQ
jgi:hypothetical protein